MYINQGHLHVFVRSWGYEGIDGTLDLQIANWLSCDGCDPTGWHDKNRWELCFIFFFHPICFFFSKVSTLATAAQIGWAWKIWRNLPLATWRSNDDRWCIGWFRWFYAQVFFVTKMTGHHQPKKVEYITVALPSLRQIIGCSWCCWYGGKFWEKIIVLGLFILFFGGISQNCSCLVSHLLNISNIPIHTKFIYTYMDDILI